MPLLSPQHSSGLAAKVLHHRCNNGDFTLTDSNRPEPLQQPPPTAYLIASGAASEVPSLLMHPCPTLPGSPQAMACRTGMRASPSGRGREGTGQTARACGSVHFDLKASDMSQCPVAVRSRPGIGFWSGDKKCGMSCKGDGGRGL